MWKFENLKMGGRYATQERQTAAIENVGNVAVGTRRRSVRPQKLADGSYLTADTSYLTPCIFAQWQKI